MPGTIGAPMPTLVMPQQLCTAFSEARNYEQRRNEYHDGTPQAGQLAQTSRRTWKLSRRLVASQLATLSTFFENVGGGLKPFLFYNPYEASPIGSNYDATGVNTTGRFIVAFRSNWSQTTGLSRSDVTQLELVELDAMDPNYEAAAGFGPHGGITSTVIYLVSAHNPNPGFTPFPGVEVSLEPIALFSAADWIQSSAQWDKRTDSKTFTYSAWDGSVLAGLNTNTGFASGLDPRDELLIYDCYAEVTFADGHVTTIRPTVADPIIRSQGGIDNPDNAIDGDPDTFATVFRTDYSPLSLGTYLALRSFPGLGS